jgi:hypothetical protein
MRGKAKHRSKEQVEHDIASQTKQCVSCLVRKPFSSFTLQSRAPDKKCNTCVDCLKEYREKNKERTSSYKKEYNEANRDYIRYRNLGKKYGVTEDWYRETLKDQQFACAICGADEPKGNGNLHFHVDHDHETGQVRGLLCSPCNVGLGKFKDSPSVLQSAINYLKNFKGI